MKNIFKNTLSLLAVTSLCFLTACKKEESTQNTKDKTTLIVGISSDNPPFEFLKDGKVVGFDIALIEAIGKDLNKKIEIKDMNFDGLLGSLTSGRIDAAISGITATEERKKAVDFTMDYYVTGISMICLKDSAIKNVNDLANQTVGAQAGSALETYANGELSAKVTPLKVKTLTKIPDLVQDLKAKRIACIIIGTKESDALTTENQDLVAIPIQGTETRFAIALPKGSPLTEKFNASLETLKKNGTLDTLKKEWLKD